jgi:serine protease
MKQRRGLVLWTLFLAGAIAWSTYDRRPTTGVEQEIDSAPPVGLADGAPGELLVDLDDDATAEEVADLERRLGIDLELNSIHARDEQIWRATVSEARIRELIRQLRSEPLVESAERDGIYSVPEPELRPAVDLGAASSEDAGWLAYRPNDPLYRHQWHMDQIGMPAAWRLSRGHGAVVAVIDTGVAFRDEGNEFRQVPDLAGTAFVPGYDFVDNDENPFDYHGHGTHVAGTIAQTTNNGVGVTGVAFESSIMPIRVLNRQGSGSWGDIADAIRYAADHGADVINMSLGGPIPSVAIWSSVRYARSKGVVVVAAAGNTGRRGVQFPGALSQVIGVSATRYDEELTWYSSWGPQIDIAAPGGDTRVDQNGDGMMDGVLQNTIIAGAPMENDYLLFNGTSMASPHVAGVAALLVSQGVTRPVAVERIMERTARSESRDPEHYGAGIVDASRALTHVQLYHGGIRLGLALMMLTLLVLGLKRADKLDGKPGFGIALGAVMGASGLFILPLLAGGLVPEPLMTLLSQPVMAWDLVVLGPGGHANPLFHSALLPLGLLLVLYGVPWLRGLVAGFAVGAAAYLGFCSLWNTVDVTWLPFDVLDHIWLWVNAAACLFFGAIALRRGD